MLGGTIDGQSPVYAATGLLPMRFRAIGRLLQVGARTLTIFCGPIGVEQRFTAKAKHRSLDAILFEDRAGLAAAAAKRRAHFGLCKADGGKSAASFRYRAVTGRRLTTAVAPALLHFFNHQTHHRGQVHALLTGSPGRHPARPHPVSTRDRHLRGAVGSIERGASAACAKGPARLCTASILHLAFEASSPGSHPWRNPAAPRQRRSQCRRRPFSHRRGTLL